MRRLKAHRPAIAVDDHLWDETRPWPTGQRWRGYWQWREGWTRRHFGRRSIMTDQTTAAESIFAAGLDRAHPAVELDMYAAALREQLAPQPVLDKLAEAAAVVRHWYATAVTIKRDSKPVASVEDSNGAFAWLLQHQGQSISYAIHHGGYTVHGPDGNELEEFRRENVR